MKHEVTFADIKSRNFRAASGQNHKLWGSIRRARADHFKFLWVDTCCIDKSDSVELSQAINSMY
ncbi:uncharacterized protein A1O9_13102 [Exophiala aquamarina CBS 119918]|uniref:Heterokaryon incompatibility domain-containing protein n=1 Tax=Exophiala aquamarina CBS 119918 TaxID=1182545 RepID=A0A072NTB0_9EURO|nr:uncharacterized protein A1O9_13102 [Exophiala aquamarina CBS 119918]KEF50846.1 hypothetical protein A1O9_13102 [Exophiala aquamarina CBS 119918]